MRRPFLALAFTAALAAGWAHAQQFSTLEERMSAADFKRAGLDKLSDDELAQLNVWLQRDAERRDAVAPSAAPANDRVGFPANTFFDARSSDDRIVTTVAGPFRGWGSAGDQITLANGQVWRLTDSDSRLRVDLVDPKVTLERNGFGGWSMQVDGYNTRARVVRVR